MVLQGSGMFRLVPKYADSTVIQISSLELPSHPMESFSSSQLLTSQRDCGMQQPATKYRGLLDIRIISSLWHFHRMANLSLPDQMMARFENGTHSLDRNSSDIRIQKQLAP